MFSKLSNYQSNIAKLLSGNFIAQLIGFFGTFIVPFYYSPTNVGQFGVVMSLISIVSIVIVLRLDTYLLIEEEKYIVSTLMNIIKVLAFQFVILSILFLYFREEINGIISQDFSTNDIVFILVISLLVSMSFVLNSYLCKINRYSGIAYSSVFRAGSVTFFQISFGIIGVAKGLLVSELLSRFCQLCSLLVFSKCNCWRVQERRKSFGLFLKKVSPFITFSTLSSLLTTGASYLPVIAIPMLLTKESSGVYFLSIQLVLLPVSMLVQAISKAFSGEFVRLEKKDAFRLVRKTMLSLAITSVIFCISYYFAFSLLHWLLPIEWQLIGSIFDLVLLLALPILCISSVSQVFNLLERQKILFLTELIKFLLISTSLFVLSLESVGGQLELRELVKWVVTSSYLGYAVQFVLLLYVMDKWKNEIR